MKKEDESQYAHRHNTLCKLSLSFLNVVLVVLSFYNGSSFCVWVCSPHSLILITSFSSLSTFVFLAVVASMTAQPSESIFEMLDLDGNYILSFALLDPLLLSSFSSSFFKMLSL